MTTDTARAEQGPLQSDRGTTVIQDTVVTAIVGMAAQEVEGISMSHGGTRLPGDTSPTVGEFVDNLTGGGSRTRGLSVEVGERQAAVDMTVNVPYGHSIPELTGAVRERVIERVQNLTGLEVTEVNITVNDVTLPEG
ncbi:MAG TPA: Asp23/Gls24 family envelope stress response protein [Rubrobacter sp.]|nr:Asp23/Gls24 family envelope stress response protein [Rubrobacter sp.]